MRRTAGISRTPPCSTGWSHQGWRKPAQAIRDEGWAWVMASPAFDFRATSDMRRVYATLPDLTAEAQRKHDTLEAEYEQLAIAANSAEDEDTSAVITARIGTIDAETEASRANRSTQRRTSPVAARS